MLMRLQEFAVSMSSISQVYFHIVDTELRHFNTLPWFKRPFFRFKSKHSIFLQALAKKSALDIATIAERALGYALPQFKQRPDLPHDTSSAHSSQSHGADDAKCRSQAPSSDDSNTVLQAHVADDANHAPPSRATGVEHPQFSSTSLRSVLDKISRHVESEVCTASAPAAHDPTSPDDTTPVNAAVRTHMTAPEAANGSCVQTPHIEPVEMPSTQMPSIQTLPSFVTTSKYSLPIPSRPKQHYPKQQSALTRAGITTKPEAFEMVPTDKSHQLPADHSVKVGQFESQLPESKKNVSTLQQQPRSPLCLPPSTASAKQMGQVLAVRSRNAKPSGAVHGIGRSSSSQNGNLARSSVQSGPRSSHDAELEEIVVHTPRSAIVQRHSHFPRN
jgi:hypothetical protein